MKLPRPLGGLVKPASSVLRSVLLCTCTLAFGQDSFPPPSVQYGFQDAIHTQLSVAREINPAPQPQRPHVLWIVDMSGWLEFDRTGGLLESGKVDAAGEHLQTERFLFGNDPDITEKTVTAGGKTTHHRWEFRTSTLRGVEYTETVEYVDGKPESHTHRSYNPSTGESQQLDDNGQMIKRWTRVDTSQGYDKQFWIDGGKTLVSHRAERFDSKGDLVQSLQYDAEGAVLWTLSFKDNTLISWWRRPDLMCGGYGTVHPDEKTMVFYTIPCAGGPYPKKTLKDVRHFRISEAQGEMTDEELYDSSGELLEHTVYSYEFDQHHNWIRCVASVMDPDTGVMVPVREFIRRLTYY